MGYTEAVKRAVETIAGDGVVITYPSGKTDTIETATLRAVRTGVSQTAAQITLQRAQENGVDLVVTSSHLGARPTHEPWQGKVFHVDYDTAMREKFRKRDSPPPTPKTTSDKYPDFVQSTRYGYVDGLCGANCRHSFYPYIEGVSHNPFEQFDSEENKKRYEAEQQQRALERAIRKSKRKCEGLKTAVDNADEATRPAMQEAYGKAAAKLRAQNAEYKQFCEYNGLKTRQDRVSIAGWDGKQAAQARAAENKIKNSDTIQSGAITGARKTPGWEERHAELFYEEVRNRKEYSDATNIIRNVEGFTLEEIEDIRQHIFIREQPRDGELKRFDPDYEQAEAWQRLIEGKKIKKSDIVLLEHERYELTIMREFGYTYEEAHERTIKLFDWQKALDEEE